MTAGTDAQDAFERAKELSLARLGGATINELLAKPYSDLGAIEAEAAMWALSFGTVPRRRLEDVCRSLLDIAENNTLPPDVRAQAAEGVANHLAASKQSRLRRVAVTRLSRLLRDPAVQVRFWSVFALGQLGGRQARAAVRPLLADTALLPGWWTVGEEASDALLQIDGQHPPDRPRAGAEPQRG